MSEIKIKYFVDYWRDLTHPHNSIENELAHSIIYNPKELLKEFIEEIDRKKLSNKDNKDFFFYKINEFARLDLKAIIFLKPVLTLIQKQFSKKEEYDHLKHLLEMSLLKMADFSLGKEAVLELAEILTDESDINREKIKHLINIVIFELTFKKYSRDEIIKIVENIFDYFHQNSANSIYTSFPHHFKCENWDPRSIEYQKYEKELSEYIKNLTDKERIESIINYFEREAVERRFVFQIKGLRGNNINIKLGNVQIYDPKFTKLFKPQQRSFSSDELFGSKGDNCYCNGAVSVEIVDQEYAKQEAIQTLDKVLDLIASNYYNYKIHLSVVKSSYYILNVEGEITGSGHMMEPDILIYQDSMDVENIKIDKLAEFFSKTLSEKNILGLDKIILESMHWRRKAVESIESNEKILWHWVTLENLFWRENASTPKTIFEVVSKLLTKHYLYKFAWKHFHKIRMMCEDTAQIQHYREKLDIPSSLKNKVGLDTKSGTCYLKNFTDNINDILTHLDKDSLLYEQIENLNRIFTDETRCSSLLERFEKNAYEKLVYIYRLRNKIVHNANSEMSPTTEYYISFLIVASAIAVNAFLNKRIDLDLHTSSDVINNILYDYDMFKLELKEKGAGILIK